MEEGVLDGLRHYLSDEQISRFPHVRFEQGETFIRPEAEDCITHYFILEGSVSVYALAYSGREFWIDTLSAGDFIGKFSQMRGNNFNCGVRCDEPCEMLVLTNHMDELLTDKDFCLYFSRRTTDRLYEMYKISMLHLLFSYDEIMSFWLLSESSRLGEDTPEVDRIRRTMNISDRQFFYLLNRLESAGLVRRVRPGRVRILDTKRLSNLAHKVSTFMRS